jgi:cytochrome P450
LPFNGGPRVCLGQKFTLNEVEYVVVKLLQEVKEIKTVKAEEWVEGLGLTCSMKNGARMMMGK